MAEAMRTLVVETQALERDEQELLALAYRNLLQPIRSAWHTISSLLPSPDHANPCALGTVFFIIRLLLLLVRMQNIVWNACSGWNVLGTFLTICMYILWGVVGAGGGKEAAIRRYREKLEADVLGVCEEVIALLQPLQVASRHNAASLVFLHKMYITPTARTAHTRTRRTQHNTRPRTHRTQRTAQD